MVKEITQNGVFTFGQHCKISQLCLWPNYSRMAFADLNKLSYCVISWLHSPVSDEQSVNC